MRQPHQVAEANARTARVAAPPRARAASVRCRRRRAPRCRRATGRDRPRHRPRRSRPPRRREDAWPQPASLRGGRARDRDRGGRSPPGRPAPASARNTSRPGLPTACTTTGAALPAIRAWPLMRKTPGTLQRRRHASLADRRASGRRRAITTKLSKSSWSCSSPSSSWWLSRPFRSASAAAERPSRISARQPGARAPERRDARPACRARTDRLDRASVSGANEVGLADDDEIGAAELVLEQLLDRIVVLARRVGRAPRPRARSVPPTPPPRRPPSPRRRPSPGASPTAS